jgi:hypothetical protein
MSVEAAVHSPPLAPDPVALHADKLRAMIADIRSNHPDKVRGALPWASIAAWINSNPEVLGVQYSYSHDSIRKWSTGNGPSTTPMLSSVSAFCIAHSNYQAREMRSEMRAIKRQAEADEEEADEQEVGEAGGASFMSPAPKRRKGPAPGSKQAATPVTINDTTYLTPPKHVIITKAQESKYKAAEAELAELLQERETVSRCVAVQHVKSAAAVPPAAFHPVCVSLWQRALGAVPSVGREAIATVGALAAAAVLYSLGLGAALAGGCDNLLQHVPGTTTLATFMELGRLSSQEWLCEKLRSIEYVYVSTDKGHRKRTAHLAKVVSFWCVELRRVLSYTADIDAAGSTTVEGTIATLASMRGLGFGPGAPPGAAHGGKVAGLSSDSGGAGVLEDAARSYVDRGLAVDGPLVANCGLHALNVLLSAVWPSHFGDGGIEKSNALQALHSVFDLQSLFVVGGKAEFDQLWLDAGCAMPPPPRMSEPIVTRWWHATTGATQLLSTYDDWVKFTAYIADGHKDAGQNRFKQATKLHLDLRNASIKCDICFLAGLAHAFFNRSFKWHQGTDSYSKAYGYRSHRMAARSFVMARDFGHLGEKIASGEEFAAYRAALAALPVERAVDAAGAAVPSQPLKKQLVESYLSEAGRLLAKHTARWRGVNLWCGLGDEPPIARAVSLVLTGGSHATGTFVSKAHGCEIDLAQLCAHLAPGAAAATVPVGLGAAVAELAAAPAAAPVALEEGVGLSDACAVLRQRIECQVLPLMSTTHRVEAVVREASFAAAAQCRGEAARSEVVVERSHFFLRVKEELRDAARGGGPGAVRTPRGKVVHAALAAKAAERALSEQELGALRRRLAAQQAAGGGTKERQQEEVGRVAAAYQQQAKLTRGEVEGSGRQRAAAQTKAPTEHTLTLVGADVDGAVKIRGTGAWQRRDVMAELRYRGIKYGGDDVKVAELKVLLEAKCSIAGHPAHFRFEMPQAWRDACDAAAAVEKLRNSEVKDAAAAAFIDTGSKKKLELVAELVALKMAVTVTVTTADGQ